MNKFHLRNFETELGQKRLYKFAPKNRKPKPKLPKIKEPTSDEMRPVFSEGNLDVFRTLAAINAKTDPRILCSRVVNDAERIDSRGGGGAHSLCGGHIHRELGVTINGHVPVGEVVVMYAHNAEPTMDSDEEVYVPFENLGWDKNFVAAGALSPDRFMKPSEKVHLLRRDIQQYLSDDASFGTKTATGNSNRRDAGSITTGDLDMSSGVLFENSTVTFDEREFDVASNSSVMDTTVSSSSQPLVPQAIDNDTEEYGGEDFEEPSETAPTFATAESYDSSKHEYIKSTLLPCIVSMYGPTQLVLFDKIDTTKSGLIDVFELLGELRKVAGESSPGTDDEDLLNWIRCKLPPGSDDMTREQFLELMNDGPSNPVCLPISKTEMIWNFLVADLRESSLSIVYKDLTSLSSLTISQVDLRSLVSFIVAISAVLTIFPVSLGFKGGQSTY